MAARILVVDDDPANGELIRLFMEDDGIETECTADSRQAADLLGREHFDAVFLDILMPAPNGIELTRRMRAAGPNQCTPVALITGGASVEMLTQGFEAGANFFLFKPLSRDRLLRLLRVSRGFMHRERRRFRRVTLRRKVSIACAAQRLEGYTVDLSLSGVQVQAPTVLPLKSAVELRLYLSPGFPVNTRGTVMRVTEDESMGIAIAPCAAVDGERLQEFLLPLISEEDR